MATVNGEAGYDMSYSMVGSGAPSGGGSGASSGALLTGSQASMAGGAIGAFGTAIGDFMSITTDKKAAAAYGQAAALAGENINITETSTNIQAAQQQRQLARTLGQQTAAVGTNGFQVNSGSGLDIYRESAEQGALAHSLIVSQGQVTENAYKAQQTADLALEAQAKAKANSDMIGGIASTAQGVLDVAMMF